MATDEGPTPPSIDLSTQSGDVPEPAPRVELVGPGKRSKGNVRQLQYNALYFAALGVWALALAFTGQPVYGVLSALVLFEMALAIFRISTFTGRIVADTPAFERVAPIVMEFCSRLGIALPRVVFRDDTLRAAMVRRRKRRVDLVLSLPYVQEVTDPQLRGIVAHEVIHLVHDDLLSVRIRAWIGILGGVVLGIAAWIAVGYQIKNLPIFLGAFTAGAVVTRILLSPLNRRCETRADMEGAELTGDAQALADALTVAHIRSNETKARLYGRQPWRWLLSPVSWRMPTHPRMATRVARLTRIG